MKKALILMVILFFACGTVLGYAGTIKSKGPDGQNTVQKVYNDISGWNWKPVTGTESKKKEADQK